MPSGWRAGRAGDTTDLHCPGPGPSPAQGHPSGHLEPPAGAARRTLRGAERGPLAPDTSRRLDGAVGAADAERWLPLFPFQRSGVPPPRRALSERRQRGASGVRHSSGKDGRAGSLREMSKHCGYPASDSPGTGRASSRPIPVGRLGCPALLPGPARPGLGREPAVPGGAARRRGAPGVAAGSVTQAVAPGAGCGGLYWPVTLLSSSGGDRAGAGRWGGGSTKAR